MTGDLSYLTRATSLTEISLLSDGNGIRNHNHLVCKQTLSHLPKMELSGCGFESLCCHLNFRYCTCFEQGNPWHSGNYRVWIHSKTRTWHDKNMQSFRFYFSLLVFPVCFLLIYTWWSRLNLLLRPCFRRNEILVSEMKCIHST